MDKHASTNHLITLFAALGVLAAVVMPQSSFAESQSTTLPVISTYLRMDQTDAQVLLRKDPYDTSSFAVSVVDGAERAEGRIKILGSMSVVLQKRSLYVKLEKGQQWRGQGRLAFNAMAGDPTLLRNWLVWETQRVLGMPAPNTDFHRIYINDQFKGIYMQTSWIDPGLFARYGYGSDGQLYQPRDDTYCGDLSPANLKQPDYCWKKLVPDDGNYGALESLIRDIDATPIAQFDTFLEKNFDVDSVLDWLAINVLTDNGDTYNKNYFLYYSKAKGKWLTMPWDYDLAYGRNYDAALEYPANIYNDNFQYYYPPELGAASPLKEKVLRNPALNARFKAHIAHLLGLKREGDAPGYGWFSGAQMSAHIEKLAEQLAPEVKQDPFWSQRPEKFREAIDAMKYFVTARAAYLQTTLFGAYPWSAENAVWRPELAPPPAPLPNQLHASTGAPDEQGNLRAVVDGYGYLLAIIRPQDTKMAEWSIEVEMAQPPHYLPPGSDASQCIQRSWFVTLKSPGVKGTAALTLEYLQETTLRSELGKVKDEKGLVLWRYEEGEWQRVPAHINTLANTFATEPLPVVPGRMMRFVACSPSR